MRRLLRWSAGLTLVALALMVWSMLAPTPLPVMIAMTVGQGLGTLAFGAYLYVIIADLRRLRREARRARELEAQSAPSEPLASRDSLNVIEPPDEPSP